MSSLVTEKLDGSADGVAAMEDAGGSGAANSALVCRDVGVSFGRREVLSGVDLELAPGEWLGLIGPNGAGKSTLLRSVVGLVSCRGHVARGDGQPVGAVDVALVPQSPAMPPGMTVAEYVLLGRTAHLGWLAKESKSDRAIAALALRRLELTGFAERVLLSLSGGEAQRVVLARALAQQSPVLLLDEPTSALDLGHQVSVLELVDSLRRTEGLSVLAAMHDLTTAARFADRLMLISQGRVVVEGCPETVLTAERLSAIYGTALTVQTIDGEIVVLPSARRRLKS